MLWLTVYDGNKSKSDEAIMRSHIVKFHMKLLTGCEASSTRVGVKTVMEDPAEAGMKSLTSY